MRYTRAILVLFCVALAAYYVGDFSVRDALTFSPHQWGYLFAAAVLKLALLIGLRVAAKPVISFALFVSAGALLAADTAASLPLAEAMAGDDVFLLWSWRSVIVGLNLGIFVLSAHEIMPKHWGALVAQCRYTLYGCVVASIGMSCFALEMQQRQADLRNDITPTVVALQAQREGLLRQAEELHKAGHWSSNSACKVDPAACSETWTAKTSEADALLAKIADTQRGAKVQVASIFGGVGAIFNAIIRGVAFVIVGSLLASIAYKHLADICAEPAQNFRVPSVVSQWLQRKKSPRKLPENVAKIGGVRAEIMRLLEERKISKSTHGKVALKEVYKAVKSTGVTHKETAEAVAAINKTLTKRRARR